MEHAEHIQQIVDALPPDLQLILAKSGLTVKTVDQVQDFVDGASLNTRAQVCQRQGAIYVAERFMRKGQMISEPETLALIVRHELGHVLDITGGFSWKKSMMDAYMKGINRLGKDERISLQDFGKGDAHGAMEAFAEIYAQLKTSATGLQMDAYRRAAIAHAFPEMIAAVRALDLP